MLMKPLPSTLPIVIQYAPQKTAKPQALQVNKPDEEGYTPLMYAARRGDLVAVRLLIKQGADVNLSHTEFGVTALTEAVTSRRFNIVNYLLGHGASINLRDKHGYTLLHRAVSDLDMVKLLLSRGACISARTKSGGTPLHHAAGGSYLDTVKLLVAMGADINARDEEGQTPLVEAVSSKRISLIEWLIKHGAKVNARTRHGSTALIRSCHYPYSSEILSLLLKAGANPNTSTDGGVTALMTACDAGDNDVRGDPSDETVAQCVILLLAYRANVGAVDCDGDGALQYAISRERYFLIPILFASSLLPF